MSDAYKDEIRSQLRARLKKEIIQNNIYGVDIEEGAIEIARLRFWLSLVIDLDKPEPLPNFDYKFMQGNSLLESYQFEVENENTNAVKKKKTVCIDLSGLCEKKGEYDHDKGVAISFEEGDKEREDLMGLMREYYSETDHAKKKELRDKIETQVRVLLDAKCSKSYSKYINAMPIICDKFFLWHLWFKDVFDMGGFDIVIGNPPYVSTKETKSEKRQYEKEFGFSDDLYNLFTFKALNSVVKSGKITHKAAPLMTKDGGILTYIMPNTFWTTQTKRSMRDLLLGKSINYIFDSANPFESVMVDTCILQVTNKPTEEEHTINFLDGREDLKNPIVLNSIKQTDYKDTLNAVIFKPTDYNLKVWKQYNQKVKALYDKWWNKIKTSKDIEKNKTELKQYRQSLKPGDIVLLGCLTEGGCGLQTGNNGKYVAVRKGTKWADNVIKSRPKKLRDAYNQCGDKEKAEFENLIGNVSPQQFLQKSTEQEIADAFDAIKERFGRDIFGQGYLYKLIDDSKLADIDSLTADEKENGIDTSKPYYVPYDKGDKDGNRWYLETPYAIAWSKENVRSLKIDSKARYQGYTFFFREGFCWNNVLQPVQEESMYIKCRLKGRSINDVASMSMYSDCNIPATYFVSLLNSKFMYDYLKTFINSTVNLQINDFRLFPILIPAKDQLDTLISLCNTAVEIKQTTNSQADWDLIQQQLDNLVYNLYGIQPNISICTNKLKQSKALVYELNGITSYSKLLQIEGNKDSALEMLILMYIHQHPADTDRSIIAKIKQETSVNETDIQTAIKALVKNKVLGCSMDMTSCGDEVYQKVYVWF